MNDQFITIGIAVCTVITVPWLVWVSSSIFNLRTQTSLLKKEIDVLNRIQDIMENAFK